ncbi:hypothetical protein [Encephalitozoon cuniculi GB-M1]|uniref:UPF0329 protein ECU02_0050 n=1 Tax=Encephalitozoon cuniculi (strain GB-M1) TaxID=284813 RepID=Y205_ENCCU|nr:uncharacterized protein ECU02_0050 [Encephalitozoon cuniculi GB-M1]Q8SWH7.1 RecName: Full=UPF0329 protein ECU02_0050 [Encephalitozoon cuniculi GB-M1]CAD25036.1 hypothetical protein [Encephalitozoon cuniculi GB-M1]
MRWKYAAWILIAVVDVMCCSSEEKSASVSFVTRPGSQVIAFPFIFVGHSIVVLPTTKYSNLKRNAKSMEDLTFLLSNLSHVVWSLTIDATVYKDGGRLEKLFDKRMRGYLDGVSLDVLRMYVNGSKTFSELLQIVYERTFECDSRRSRQMARYGESLIREIDNMIESMPAEMSEEEKEKMRSDLNNNRKYVESFHDTEKWRQVVEAEKMVCNTCKEICLGLKEEELMGLLAEGSAKKYIKASAGESKVSSTVYPEYIVVDISLLLDAHREHGGDVTKELVKQMLLGKKEEEIDKRYIGKVANAVKERRRRGEKEIEKRVKKLLRDEEKAKSKKRGKRKSVGVSEAKEEEKKESETEEVEAGEEVEMPSEEVGGARRKTGKKSEGGRKRYKIHRRVLRWRKSPEKIKEEWDKGSEERWRGKSLEEIREQKVFHDIMGVLELLRSPDADRFFMDTGDYTKGGSERQRMVAIGVLESGGKRMLGVVEVGTFKDCPSGCPVVYHLMFRVTGIEGMGDVMRRGGGQSW